MGPGPGTRLVRAANLPRRDPSAAAGRALGQDPGRDAFPPLALSLLRENSKKKPQKPKTRVGLRVRYNHLHTLRGPFVGHSWNLSVNARTSFPHLTYFCISSKLRAEVEFTEQERGEHKGTGGTLPLLSLTPSITQTMRPKDKNHDVSTFSRTTQTLKKATGSGSTLFRCLDAVWEPAPARESS